MTQIGQATVSAPPIRALIIQPNSCYEIREIDQTSATFRALLGASNLEAVGDRSITFWVDEDGKNKGLPFNSMASFLWWKMFPAMEALDTLNGPVVVTGGPDEAGDSLPVPEAVVELYRQMEAIRLQNEAQGTEGEHAP